MLRINAARVRIGCLGAMLLAISSTAEAQLPAWHHLAETLPLKSQPEDRRLVRLLVDRYNAALNGYQAAYGQYEVGIVDFDSILVAGERLFKARLELADERGEDAEAKAKILQQFLRGLREQESSFQQRFENPIFGGTNTEILARVRYVRLGIEIELERLGHSIDLGRNEAVASPQQGTIR